ncbi:ChaB family protein [Candidatus Parcubacteria bacterium]|nr:ChaB family protein [Candidatus Parcubacteria bacterium]
MPQKKDLPSTLERSGQQAQETWSKTHDSAVESYGDGEQAHRTAYASLKHSFEKVDDHWEPKDKKGPSDPRAKQGAEAAREGKAETYGGVDAYGNSKQELLQRARKLDVKGRSTMNKQELAKAISKKQ